MKPTPPSVLIRLHHFLWLLLFVALPIQASDFDRGLLWRVDVSGAAPSYLFGTIHSEDPRVLRLPPKVEQAFDQADHFSMEIIPDLAAMTLIQQAMFYLDGRKLAEDMGAVDMLRIERAMAEFGMPAPLIASMKPWAVMMTLSMPKPKTGLFLDMVLYQRALAGKKVTHGLETPAEQIAIFDELRREDQIQLLRETLDFLPQKNRILDAMHRAYLREDLAELDRLNSSQLSSQSQAIVDRFMSRLLDGRNQKMVSRMNPLLQGGSAFIAVGALHLYGDQGIPSLLRRAGYRVSVIN